MTLENYAKGGSVMARGQGLRNKGVKKTDIYAKGGDVKGALKEFEAEDKKSDAKLMSKVMKHKGMKAGGGVKFIQKAIKKPGQLHKDLGVPQGKKIPEAKLEAAEKKPGKIGQRARFAETLKGMRKK